MTKKRNRLRRRKKFMRSVRRIVKTVLLAPGKMPPIDLRTVETCMILCETFGVFFVITLIARLSTATAALSSLAGASLMTTVVSVSNILFGIGFLMLLLFIKLADYQDRLVRMDMADYIYIR